MNHMFEAFAYGNMAPNAQPDKGNPQYRDAMIACSKKEERLLETLNEDEKAIFHQYIDAHHKVNQLTALYNWVHGYKLGLLITAEAFVTG